MLLVDRVRTERTVVPCQNREMVQNLTEKIIQVTQVKLFININGSIRYNERISGTEMVKCCRIVSPLVTMNQRLEMNHDTISTL